MDVIELISLKTRRHFLCCDSYFANDCHTDICLCLRPDETSPNKPVHQPGLAKQTTLSQAFLRSVIMPVSENQSDILQR